jgi:hypothetical protein
MRFFLPGRSVRHEAAAANHRTWAAAKRYGRRPAERRWHNPVFRPAGWAGTDTGEPPQTTETRYLAAPRHAKARVIGKPSRFAGYDLAHQKIQDSSMMHLQVLDTGGSVAARASLRGIAAWASFDTLAELATLAATA